MGEPDYASKIEALLRKAEDPAATPEEAKTYSEKAEALMVKWGISDAMLAAAKGEKKRDDKIVERKHTIHHRYYQAEVMLVHYIGKGMGTVRVLKHDSYNHTSTVFLIGYESDLNRVEMLWKSLWLQAERALTKWWKEYKQTDVGRARTKSSEVFKDRREFYLNFGSAVRTRLREMYQKEEKSGEPGTALALVDRGKQVDDEVNRMYGGNLKAGRGMQVGGTYASRMAGGKAGREADLGNRNVGTGRKGELS